MEEFVVLQLLCLIVHVFGSVVVSFALVNIENLLSDVLEKI
jgi:hypothetical protein